MGTGLTNLSGRKLVSLLLYARLRSEYDGNEIILQAARVVKAVSDPDVVLPDDQPFLCAQDQGFS